MKQAKLILLTIPMFLLMGCHTSSGDNLVLDISNTPSPLNILWFDHRHHYHRPRHIERIFVHDVVEYSDYTTAHPHNETSAHSHLWPNGEGVIDN